MGTRGFLCVLLLWALAASGCAYQRAIVTSSDMPDWMVQKPADTPDRFFYVGEGRGTNIVDTRQARASAMQDVRDQIVASLAPVAVEQAIAIADQAGAPHDTPDAERARCAREIQDHIEQALPAVQQDASYWEKWASKSDLLSAPTYEYRYFVLASMSKEMRDKLTTELVHQIADAIEARAKPPVPEAPTAAE
jgi:hypothetical protein